MINTRERAQYRVIDEEVGWREAQVVIDPMVCTRAQWGGVPLSVCWVHDNLLNLKIVKHRSKAANSPLLEEAPLRTSTMYLDTGRSMR